MRSLNIAVAVSAAITTAGFGHAEAGQKSPLSTGQKVAIAQNPGESKTPLSRTEMQALMGAIQAQSDRLELQTASLEAQRREIERQREELKRLSEQLIGARAPSKSAKVTVPLGRSSAKILTVAPRLSLDGLDLQKAAGTSKTQQAQRNAPKKKAGQEQEQQKERTRPPDIEILSDVGGVLTPKGTLVVDTQFEFTHASLNRFFFQGVEVVEAVLIGVIEATDADRDTFSPSIGARFGVTDRIEVDARVPYIWRDDRVTNTEIATGTNNIQNLSGEGIGDIDFGVHYQINNGQGGWPFLVGNLRVKSDTGTSPFDVDRDAAGIETELATGSGFWALEPSMTFIFPTDPAVLFANVGYLWNIERDINQQIGGSLIGTVDPGDALTMSFGIGLALNEKLSVNFGYQHSYVLGTVTEVNGLESESNTLQSGSFLFGMSYSIANNVGFNLSLAAGLTEDAPDAQITMRVPISFGLFD